MAAVRTVVDEFRKENPKLGELLSSVLDDIERDRYKYAGQDMSILIHELRREAVKKAASDFAAKWFMSVDDVLFEVAHYRTGVMSNETNFKEKADYAKYKESVSEPLKKFKFHSALVREFKENLINEIKPLL